jgi:RNA-directed DNA polymerase
VQAVCAKISELTERRTTWRDEQEQVGRLNALLRGWANYFSIGSVTAAWQVVQEHACRRLRRWLQRKHRRPRGRGHIPDLRLYADWGLLHLYRGVRRSPLWANV